MKDIDARQRHREAYKDGKVGRKGKKRALLHTAARISGDLLKGSLSNSKQVTDSTQTARF